MKQMGAILASLILNSNTMTTLLPLKIKVIMKAEWCRGNTLASCADCSGFYPSLMQVVQCPVTKLQIGTASAGNTHSLAGRTHPLQSTLYS